MSVKSRSIRDPLWTRVLLIGAAAVFIGVICIGHQPGAGKHRVQFLQDAPFGQRNDKRRIGFSRRTI